jgi:hypothetical protein
MLKGSNSSIALITGAVIDGVTHIGFAQTVGGTSDATINWDAANILGQRNGTSAQGYRIYNTFTDASNYERGVFGWTGSNQLQIGSQAAGTGTGRVLQISGNGINFFVGSNFSTQVWNITGSGHFTAQTDNSFDVGAFGATRPRNLYVGSAIFTTAPVSEATATRTVGATDNNIISTGSATLTLTLPAVATSTGRTIRVKTTVAFTVVSATSNVVPLAGGSAGTAILAATAGKWADLTCDGSSWVIMASN